MEAQRPYSERSIAAGHPNVLGMPHGRNRVSAPLMRSDPPAPADHLAGEAGVVAQGLHGVDENLAADGVPGNDEDASGVAVGQGAFDGGGFARAR